MATSSVELSGKALWAPEGMRLASSSGAREAPMLDVIRYIIIFYKPTA